MNTDLKNKIMRRAYIAAYLRRALSPAATKAYIIVIFLWSLGKLVWVDQVFQNAPGLARPAESLSFAAQAFTNTEVAVQIIVLALTALFLWLARDIIFRHRTALLANF